MVIPLYLGQFDTNDIIFRNIEFFNQSLLLKENKESNKIFKNISFVEMKSSKSIHYLTNIGQGG